MAAWYSDQILKTKPTLGVGGLLGAPGMIRSTESRGGIVVWRFSFTQGSPQTVAAADTIDLAYLTPATRIYAMTFTFSAGGGTATFSVGKYDPNNPTGATTDPTHYFNATPISAAGNSGPLTSNLGEQVGLDNIGDQTAGNTAPAFGAAPIVIRGTFGGSAPTAATVISGYLFVVEGGQD